MTGGFEVRPRPHENHLLAVESGKIASDEPKKSDTKEFSFSDSHLIAQQHRLVVLKPQFGHNVHACVSIC